MGVDSLCGFFRIYVVRVLVKEMKTLTVFTPTYNRAHTLPRLFQSLCVQTTDDFEWLLIDDGSSDGTRSWVEGLGRKIVSEGARFGWMGCRIEGKDENSFVLEVLRQDDLAPLHIRYVYKDNGGLYTGYNVAYTIIETELCVCVDSDDYLPDDAVERIVRRWKTRPHEKEYCGIVGLDFNVMDGNPIGGFFSGNLFEAYHREIRHIGDLKQVMRTDLMRKVAPQIGFEGEKDFNPFYMLMQVLDEYPILVSNEIFCWVEYQVGADSMSCRIWEQYFRSPRSYAKYRIAQMSLKHGNSWGDRFRVCVHYVSSCLLSRDVQWIKNSPLKGLTIIAAPLGLALWLVILYKNKK